MRRWLEALVDSHRRSQVAAAIVEGYHAREQTEADVGWPDEATVRMIAEEPW